MNLVLIEHSPLEKRFLEEKIGSLCTRFLGDRVRHGCGVLIKPHLHMAVAAESAVNTHPLVIRAVAKWCLERGARVRIADYPVFDPVDTIARKGGYVEALSDLDMELKSFLATEKVDLGEPFGVKNIAREALGADVVINLPKLKTDTVLGLQTGASNLIGCLPPEERVSCLAETAFDRPAWTDLLLAVCRKVRPALTIVDGVLALEGAGPGVAGNSRLLELVVAGTNTYAVDKTTAALVGFDPAGLLICRRAQEKGIFDGRVRAAGDFSIAADFKRPIADLAGRSRRWTGREKKYFLQRPVADNRRCKLCSACWQSCPAQAIAFSTKGIRIDAARCIRCYQCFGLCPHGALAVRVPLAGRLKKKKDDRRVGKL